MGFCSIDCTSDIATLRFKSWESTYDVKAESFKIQVTEQSVSVIALCTWLSSSDEVSYSKKVENNWSKCEPPAKPFLLTFKFNKKTYQTYQDKQWVDTEPSIYEKFATTYLERTCDPAKQYSGYFAVYPIRDAHSELLLNFDESSPDYQKAVIFREQRIEMALLETPNQVLADAVFPEYKSFSGGKKFKTPAESLSEKISAVNELIQKEIGCATVLTGVPTNTRLETLLTNETLQTDTDFILPAIEVRDLLLRFF